MACPICSCSMAQISGGMGRPLVYWCQTCGTLKTLIGDHEQVDTPRWAQTLEREIIRDVARAAMLRQAREGEQC
jgi:hypothetical protein